MLHPLASSRCSGNTDQVTNDVIDSLILIDKNDIKSCLFQIEEIEA